MPRHLATHSTSRVRRGPRRALGRFSLRLPLLTSSVSAVSMPLPGSSLFEAEAPLCILLQP